MPVSKVLTQIETDQKVYSIKIRIKTQLFLQMLSPIAESESIFH